MILHIFIGIFIWSLYGYFGHRYWHYLMSRNIHWKIYYKEELHHAHYDYPNNPDERYESWPIDVWLMTLVLTVLYGLLFSLKPGILFGAGAFGAMLIDDQTHRAYHSGNLNWQWFIERHRKHHAGHDCNFSFVTGAIWDRIFTTRK